MLSSLRLSTTLFSFAAIAALLLFASPAHALGVVHARAELDGASEVPSVHTEATGHATLIVIEGLHGSSRFHFHMRVRGIDVENLKGAGSNDSPFHIHAGAPGTNGGIILDLGHFARVISLHDGFLVFARGDITKVQGHLDTGLTPEEIIDRIEDDKAYVNVHTAAYPSGEIRGNLEAR